MDKAQWKELAERRVRNILRQRRIASKRQLETKISEAGPPHMRANPHHVSEAIAQLYENGEVIIGDSISIGVGQPTTLFAPSN